MTIMNSKAPSTPQESISQVGCSQDHLRLRLSLANPNLDVWNLDILPIHILSHHFKNELPLV